MNKINNIMPNSRSVDYESMSRSELDKLGVERGIKDAEDMGRPALIKALQDMDAESSNSTTNSKTMDYESMSRSELDKLGVEKGIEGAEDMGRPALIEALQDMDAESSNSTTNSKTMDYESMSRSELDKLGVEKGIEGAEDMGRPALIEALEEIDYEYNCICYVRDRELYMENLEEVKECMKYVLNEVIASEKESLCAALETSEDGSLTPSLVIGFDAVIQTVAEDVFLRVNDIKNGYYIDMNTWKDDVKKILPLVRRIVSNIKLVNEEVTVGYDHRDFYEYRFQEMCSKLKFIRLGFRAALLKSIGGTLSMEEKEHFVLFVNFIADSIVQYDDAKADLFIFEVDFKYKETPVNALLSKRYTLSQIEDNLSEFISKISYVEEDILEKLILHRGDSNGDLKSRLEYICQDRKAEIEKLKIEFNLALRVAKKAMHDCKEVTYSHISNAVCRLYNISEEFTFMCLYKEQSEFIDSYERALEFAAKIKPQIESMKEDIIEGRVQVERSSDDYYTVEERVSHLLKECTDIIEYARKMLDKFNKNS